MKKRVSRFFHAIKVKNFHQKNERYSAKVFTSLEDFYRIDALLRRKRDGRADPSGKWKLPAVAERNQNLKNGNFSEPSAHTVGERF